MAGEAQWVPKWSVKSAMRGDNKQIYLFEVGAAYAQPGTFIYMFYYKLSLTEKKKKNKTEKTTLSPLL